MSGHACEDCGWPWPLAGKPPAGAECDNCGGELTEPEPPSIRAQAREDARQMWRTAFGTDPS